MSTENKALREMLSAFIAQQAEFNEYQRGINVATQAQLNGIQDELTEFKDEANSKFAEADARFESLANDAAEVKGGHEYIMTIQRPEIVAERLGFHYDTALTAGKLVDMTRELPEVIPNDNERESFLNADLVLKRLRFHIPARQGIAAGVAERWISEPIYRPAYAAVASVKNDAVTQSHIDNEELLWYGIRAADLQPS